MLRYATFRLVHTFLHKIKTRLNSENFKEITIDVDIDVLDKVNILMPALKLKELAIGFACSRCCLLKPTIPKVSQKRNEQQCLEEMGCWDGKKNGLLPSSERDKGQKFYATVYFCMHISDNMIGRVFL